MTNLFVDCDDTLFLYNSGQIPNPYGFWKGLSYTPNAKLIQGIRDFRSSHLDHKLHKIVIWSGGGAGYARECAVQLGISGICSLFLIKDPSEFYRIQEGDIVVDDEDLDGIRTHQPGEWPE